MMKTWDISIPENQYAEVYENEIVPYLRKKRETRMIPVNADGQSIYTFWYRADQPVATILISHGFTEGLRKYDEMAWQCLHNHINVVIMAHCGHDRSYRLVDDESLVHIDSCQRYIHDLLQIARKVRWEFRHEPLYLFGHSMGGGIAIAAAETFPDLFHGLILSSPMIRPQTGAIPWRTAKTIARAAVRRRHESSYLPGHQPYHEESFESSAGTSRSRFEVYKKLRQKDIHLQTSAATYSWLKEAGSLERYIYQNVRNLDMPVLLMQAGKDTFVSNSAQDAFLASLPGSTPQEKVYLPFAKHEIYQSNDEENTQATFYHALFSFIDYWNRKNI